MPDGPPNSTSPPPAFWTYGMGSSSGAFSEFPGGDLASSSFLTGYGSAPQGGASSTQPIDIIGDDGYNVDFGLNAIAELPVSGYNPYLSNIVPGTLPGGSMGLGAADVQVTLGFDASQGAGMDPVLGYGVLSLTYGIGMNTVASQWADSEALDYAMWIAANNDYLMSEGIFPAMWGGAAAEEGITISAIGIGALTGIGDFLILGGAVAISLYFINSQLEQQGTPNVWTGADPSDQSYSGDVSGGASG